MRRMSVLLEAHEFLRKKAHDISIAIWTKLYEDLDLVKLHAMLDDTIEAMEYVEQMTIYEFGDLRPDSEV